MKIAIFGGTHGNEPVGIEVIKALRNECPKSDFHTYETFLGNPEAVKQKIRYLDFDLNRAFGVKANPKGIEKQRAEVLKKEVLGKFDLILDLHTTTTNMGLTAILNNTNRVTQQVCCFLKSRSKNFKLIEEIDLDEDCTHLNRLAPAGVTIEVGPVANNVVSADLVLKTYQMVLDILNWDFNEKFDYSKTEVYKTVGTIHYPKEEGWYIHPDLEHKDFDVIKAGDPLFINIKGETLKHSPDFDAELFPFFINEAAYLNDRVAMILAKKQPALLSSTKTL